MWVEERRQSCYISKNSYSDLDLEFRTLKVEFARETNICVVILKSINK